VKHILVYGDSLTWGIIPNTRRRLAFEQRWPAVLEKKLNHLGQSVRMTEDCLNGRRTVWEDPFKPGRKGITGLGQCLETHSPLALVILMLGNNDFQSTHPYNNAWSSGQGITAMVNEIRRAPIEPGMPVPPVLVVCPPPITRPQGSMTEKFQGAEEKCVGLADAYRQVTANLGCYFFDAGSVTPLSPLDGVHLDADQHMLIGEALVGVVAPILA
jgi:lysophospholipase L1-like esterase